MIDRWPYTKGEKVSFLYRGKWRLATVNGVYNCKQNADKRVHMSVIMEDGYSKVASTTNWTKLRKMPETSVNTAHVTAAHG